MSNFFECINGGDYDYVPWEGIKPIPMWKTKKVTPTTVSDDIRLDVPNTITTSTDSPTITLDDRMTLTPILKIENSRFFDDDMLEFLLEDIMEQKAKESEKKLKKAIEDDKRDRIKEFANKIDHIIFHDPHTIVFWKDGSITRVKCQEGDIYDPEKGLAIAIIKHIFGDTNYFNTIFKKWITDEDE